MGENGSRIANDESRTTKRTGEDRRHLVSAVGSLHDGGLNHPTTIAGDPMQGYSAAAFENTIRRALNRIQDILTATRTPLVASDVHHLYEDKFLLAEFITNSALAAQLNVLEAMGLTGEHIETLRAWTANQVVYLRFSAEETCELDRTEVHEVESGTRVKEVKTKGVFGTSTKKVEEKVITKVKKYYWSYHTQYQITAVSINDPSSRITVHTGQGHHELVTTSESTPQPKRSAKPDLEVNINLLLMWLNDELQCRFRIEREHDFCFTPRRNDDIDSALGLFYNLGSWFEGVARYFQNEIFSIPKNHERDLSMITDERVLIPVMPLFESPDLEQDSPVLSPASVNLLLNHQKSSLQETFDRLAFGFEEDGTVLGRSVATLVVTALHGTSVAERFVGSIEFIETMLLRQLRQAIGKEVTPDDFSEYMHFHNRKIFAPAYAPVAFHHAIRRPDHDPEGVISIEKKISGSAEPISTFVRSTQATQPMYFLINAATRIAFMGERHVHGYVAHQFSGQAPPVLRLAARARQFSSFVLMVGRIASADLFEPKAAMIIQNKDDLRIPLMLEQIPTPKEFKDAIVSLSPEQQRFAKAYRGMQLESTLFGLCVVQIKPQLEKLLKLPEDSLTKEIKLTQQLLELFITYQIPSDLISYAGEPDAPVSAKVQEVTRHVGRMYEMIQLQKNEELAEQQQKQAYQVAELEAETAIHVNYSTPSSPVDYASPAQGAAPPMAMLGGAPPPAPGGAPMPPPSAPAPRKSARPMESAPAPPPPQARAAKPQPVPEAAAPPEPVVDATAPQQSSESGGTSGPSTGDDYTRIPVELDKRFEELDEDDALRPTIIKPGATWTLRRQKSLLSEPTQSTLHEDEQREERQRCFDLLDALTRSGALALDDASLHVVIAATHGFDKTLTNTVIQRSVNPIEKVEHSSLIVASTIQRTPVEALTRSEEHDRLETYSPMLFGPPETPSE